SHAGESVLAALRDEEIAPTPALTTVLLAMVDAIRRILGEIEASGRESDGDDARLIEQLAELQRGGSPSLAPPAPVAPSGPPAASEPVAAPAPDGPAAETSIRVDVALLDRLMNLVGELVLARNQIVQSMTASGDAALSGATQQLNLITSELQDSVMKT